MSGQDLMESGRALSSSSERSLYIVRTRATSLLLSEAVSVLTSSIHRPDGDPTEAINSLARRILTIPHSISLLAVCEFSFCEFLAFCIFLILQVYFLALIYFLEYEMHISAKLKFLGLSCDIILYLFLHKSFLLLLFAKFFYPNKNIFGIFFFGKFLLDLLQNHVCQQSTPQGPSEACGR
jgi:hypothetical protein